MFNPEEILDTAHTHPEKVADILTRLHERGETPEEITALIRELQKRMVRVEYTLPVFDVCGTGGSGVQRINLSTVLAIRLAQQFPIAKHGNRASGGGNEKDSHAEPDAAIAVHRQYDRPTGDGHRPAGRVGGMDIVEALGYPRCETPGQVQSALRERNLAFVFAPAFHPALKALAPIRRALPHPTIFNCVGPLLNPVSSLRAQMVGVSSPEMGEKLAQVAVNLCKDILLVHDTVLGLDDVSPLGATRIWKVQKGAVESYTLEPEDMGIPRAQDPEAILGGTTPQENTAIARALLEGTAPKAHQAFLEVNHLMAQAFFSEYAS